MANKQLTAKVRLNTSQAEQKLKNLANAIDALNRTVNKQSNAYNKVNAALNATAKTAQKVKNNTDNTTKSTQKWANALGVVNQRLNGSSRSVGLISSKLRRLASTYLGVMGTGAMVRTSDMITSSENKLNNINSKQLGAAGSNADGSYSQATLNATQETMDKMYASAQKVRMSYTDMMTNVSKSMTLAGDAFQGNIDNAIRFQEVMAESYAIGGASAAEMSSSMYQLMQALGAGVLAGDELRSVREGAPLAYKAIEEFAQGVYGTKESLKELGSQGKITSDMVVAAMLNAGNTIDTEFAQTAQTFSQTWEQIKNAAKYAFIPISKMLRDALNGAIEGGMVQKIESMFSTISKAIQIVFKLTSMFVNWVVENWPWLKNVIVGVFIAMATYSLVCSLVSIACAIATKIAWWTSLTEIQKAAVIMTARVIACFGVIFAMVLALVYIFYLWKTASIDTCTAIVYALLVVAAALVLIGIITGNLPLIAIAALVAILAFFFYFLEEIYGGFYGLVGWIGAACDNIGIFFTNLWHGATAKFWDFIGNVLNGLKGLEPAFNALAKLFGIEGVSLSGLAKGAYAKADAARGKVQSYNNLGDAWSTGYQKGYSKGEGIKNKINNWGSKYQTGFDGLSLDNIGKKLGLDFGKSTGSTGLDTTFPNVNDPAYALDTTDPKDLLGNIDDKLGDVKGDTGSIADSMELTEEDLKYMRELANMEWKKEYTTAHVAVHMNNKNTINNKGDLDNWVITLRDMLTEEIDAVANGVYA